MLRRLSAVLLLSTLIAAIWGGPAHADGDLGVGNPGQHTISILARRGQALSVTTFAGSGPMTGGGIQVDLSALDSRIAVTADGQSCGQSGRSITCDSLYSVQVTPGATAGPGPSGHLTVRANGDTATINVDVLTPAQSTLAGNSVTITGKSGTVVTAQLILTNKGPNSLYQGGFSTITIPDNTRLVSIDGCSRPRDLDCIRDYFPVGSSLRVTLHLRIVSCSATGDTGGYGLLSNPAAKFVFGRLTVRCSSSTQTTGGSAPSRETGRAFAAPVTSPTSAAAAVPTSTTPAPASQPAVPSTPAVPAPTLATTAGDQSPAGSFPYFAVAALVLVGALAIFGLRARRSRRTAG